MASYRESEGNPRNAVMQSEKGGITNDIPALPARPFLTRSDERRESRRSLWVTSTYNVAALLIPVLYQAYGNHAAVADSTLGIIDTKALSSITTYMQIVLEGFPCAAWTVIGDKASRSTYERIGLCKTLITVQFMLGLLISYHVYSSAASFVLPTTSQELSKGGIEYIQLHAWTFCSTILEHSVATTMRAFDYPEISFVMAIAKVGVHQALTKYLVPSTMSDTEVAPILTLLQITLASSLLASFAGLIDFIIVYLRLMREQRFAFPNPSLNGLLTLCPIGLGSLALAVLHHDPRWMQWLGFRGAGADETTGLLKVTDIGSALLTAIVLGLEVTTLTFSAQRYAAWTHSHRAHGWQLPGQQDMKRIATPAVYCAGIAALAVVVTAVVLRSPTEGLLALQPRPSAVVITSTSTDLKGLLLTAIYVQGADLLFAVQPLPWLLHSLTYKVWRAWSKS